MSEKYDSSRPFTYDIKFYVLCGEGDSRTICFTSMLKSSAKSNRSNVTLIYQCCPLSEQCIVNTICCVDKIFFISQAV